MVLFILIFYFRDAKVQQISVLASAQTRQFKQPENDAIGMS
jgi:hypothetical protein